MPLELHASSQDAGLNPVVSILLRERSLIGKACDLCFDTSLSSVSAATRKTIGSTRSGRSNCSKKGGRSRRRNTSFHAKTPRTKPQRFKKPFCSFLVAVWFITCYNAGMSNNNEFNPYRPPPIVQNDFHGDVFSPFEKRIILAARLCSLFPLINVVLEYAYISQATWTNPLIADQHIIFLVGTWFYALLSIPAVIGIGVFKSRAMLVYGIFITMFFCFISLINLLWVLLSSHEDPEIIYPAMFGIPPLILCIAYFLIYLSSICIYILALKIFNQKR